MKNLITILVLLVAFNVAQGQDTLEVKELVLVKMTNGNEFSGYIINDLEKEIQLEELKLGRITLQKSEVADLRKIRNSELKESGEIWPENTFGARYFFAPNSYNMRKGQGYYQNTLVFFNQVSYAFTDHFTLGVGTIPLFLFAGTSSPFWITPKVSVPVIENKLNVGAGGLFGTVLGESNSGFGIGYGTITVGDRNSNLNLGLGYGYLDGDWSETPTISLSGMLRVSNKFYLISENYLIDKDVVIFSGGGRVDFRRVNLDFALVLPIDLIDSGVFIPWISVGVPFGKNRKDKN